MWQSKWQAQFVKPVMAQLIAIINRDIGYALAAANPGANYPAFAEYDVAEVPKFNLPALLLVPESMAFDIEQPDSRSYSLRLLCAVAVTHQDPNQVAQILEDYLLAVDQVLNSAWELTTSDFYATDIPLPSPPFAPGATSPGLQAASLKLLFFEGHAYDELRQTAEALFAKSATTSIRIEMIET